MGIQRVGGGSAVLPVGRYRRRIVAVAAVSMAVVVAAGCGGSGPSPHDRVSSYITTVDPILQGLAAPSLVVSNASRELARPKADHADVSRKLTTAARRIDALRVRLAAVTTPAEAHTLRSLLLELMSREAALAREVAGVATFFPAFDDALKPLSTAGSRLRVALIAKGTLAPKVSALGAYVSVLDATLRRLRALPTPPAVAATVYATQIQTLERTRAAAQALETGLRKKHLTRIPLLAHRFGVAAVGNQSLAAQKGRIAATRRFNESVRGLSLLETSIYKERARLQKTLK